MSPLAIVPLGAALLYLVLLTLMVRTGIRARLSLAYTLYLVILLGQSIARLGLQNAPDTVRWLLGLQVNTITQFAISPTLLFIAESIVNRRQRTRWIIGGYVLLALSIISIRADLLIHRINMTPAGLAYVLGPAGVSIALYGLICVGIALWDLFVNYREERDPIQLRRLGLLVIVNLLSVSITTGHLFFPARFHIIGSVINAAGTLAILYALFYYRIPNMLLLVRVGVTRLFLALVIGATYLLCLYAVQWLFTLGLGPKAYILPFAFATMIILLFRVQHDRIQDMVDRLFFHERFKAHQELVALGRSATSILDLDLLTHIILDRAREALGITQSCLLLRDDRTGEFTVASQRGLDPETSMIRLRSDHPVVNWLAATLQPLSRRHLQSLPQFRALWSQERAELEELAGELYVPLNVNAELVGILVVGAKASLESLASRDQDVLTMLANQTAAAVANARLLNAAQKHVAELTTLQEMGMKLSASLDLTIVLGQITASALKLVEASTVRLFLYNPAQQSFTFGVGLDQSRDGDAPPTTIFEPDGLARTVARHSQVIAISNAPAHPLYVGEGHPPRAAVGLPLKRTENILGVLTLAFEGPHLFSEAELRALSLLADQAAMAIENARLYQETDEQKRRIETILAQTFSGIMLVDPEFRITVLNPGLEAIIGCRLGDAVGRSVKEVFEENLWGEGSLLHRAAMTGARIDPEETVLVGQRGRRDVLQGVTPLCDSQQKVIGYLMSFADITRLKEVDRLKSDIVANVSHELRAPLASIKAYTELLLDRMDGDDPALRGKFLSIIDGEADRLSNLITDLLDLSRLESGHYRLRRTVLRVADIVREAAELFKLQLQAKSLQLNIQLPVDGGECLADRDMLFLIVKNLLSNAIKFSLPEQHIGIQGEYNHNTFVLCVSDEGVGIPAEALPNLFQKFYRVRSTTESGIEGTGLGLALVKQATEAHGGTVEVKSALHQGTTFTVRMPLS